ncbi:TetR/AcrR family transcriptional regulator [Paenibacillus sp. 1P07SE]|uniref:TetR/AcrR family transcriptional regulator n=1 Tax=Paenibacillus sp. 1P07SE TaxID=3132209 RepID=UPI0039A44B71
MMAVKELILDGRIHNFTIQKVADLAGVSYASVYKYYPSREQLLISFRDWSSEVSHLKVDPPPYVKKLEELPSWVEKAIPMFDGRFADIRALFSALEALQIRDVLEQSRNRDEWIRCLIDEAFPRVSEERRRISYHVMRMLVSMRTWLEYEGRHGLSLAEIVTVVSEGIKAQIAYLHAAELERN